VEPDPDSTVVAKQADLQRAANRRWIRMLVTLGVVIAVLVPVLDNGVLFQRRAHRHHQGNLHHHSNPVAGIVALAVILLFLVPLLIFVRRSYKRGGVYSAPMMMGLPRRGRRAVVKSVKAGTLSVEPLVRTAEIEFARRTVRQARRSYLSFAVFLVIEAWILLLNSDVTDIGRVYFAVVGALFVWRIVSYLRLVRGARQIVAQTTADGR
jgi:hypothetical protein